METQFRPFSLACSLIGDETNGSGITLRDGVGTALKCNFVSIEASGSNSDSYFRVTTEVPATDSLFEFGQSTASGAMNTMTSGVIGGYASTQKGVVEFLLSDADRTSLINIQCSEVGLTNFFITYGQIQAGNIRRDNERTPGL
tara:strand:- start:972 stop:1400 length:429 start_codon:yes stop_codon:yes gene_type:complete